MMLCHRHRRIVVQRLIIELLENSREKNAQKYGFICEFEALKLMAIIRRRFRRRSKKNGINEWIYRNPESSFLVLLSFAFHWTFCLSMIVQTIYYIFTWNVHVDVHCIDSKREMTNGTHTLVEHCMFSFYPIASNIYSFSSHFFHSHSTYLCQLWIYLLNYDSNNNNGKNPIKSTFSRVWLVSVSPFNENHNSLAVFSSSFFRLNEKERAINPFRWMLFAYGRWMCAVSIFSQYLSFFNYTSFILLHLATVDNGLLYVVHSKPIERRTKERTVGMAAINMKCKLCVKYKIIYYQIN